MSNQYRQLENFMQMLKDAAKGPNVQISAKDIYEELKNYGVHESVKGQYLNDDMYTQIRSALDYRTDDFNCSYLRQSPDQHEPWQHFTTMSRSGGSGYGEDFKGKMYIPIKPGQISNVGEKVIKYLIDNKITTKGKIANTFRSDTLIINFLNPDDASKVLNFITYSSDIYKLLGIHNPFIPDYNGVGYTPGHDNGSDSYSRRVAVYLEKYLAHCKKLNNPELINIDDFLAALEYQHVRNKVRNPQEAKQLIDNLKTIVQSSKNDEKKQNPVQQLSKSQQYMGQTIYNSLDSRVKTAGLDKLG